MYIPNKKEIDKLNNSINESEKFIERAKKLRDYLLAEDREYYCYTLADRSSLKRQSMELTRSLALLRNRNLPKE